MNRIPYTSTTNWQLQGIKWARRPDLFVFEACRTYDEVDPGVESKPIPRKGGLLQLVQDWVEFPKIAVPKSRRMVVTWTILALDLWVALHVRNSQVYVASKNQTDSDKLLKRVLFMYDHLPPIPKPYVKILRGKGGDPTKIDFPEINSKIEALSEDPDKMRQEGATLLHIEEFPFWQWPEESYKAMLPTVLGGGRMVIVSSAQDASLFKKIVFDELDKAQRE